MSQWDAIVVGAGPAGSWAAQYMAARGRSVLILERDRFPRNKTCAGWLNRKALEEFEELAQCANTFVESAFYGVIFHSASGGRTAQYREDRPTGYLVRRDKFDAALLQIAVDAGATCLQQANFEAVDSTGSKVVVRLSDGSAHEASALIGADGVNGVTGRLTGLNPAWDSSSLVVCSNEDVPLYGSIIDSIYGQGRERYIHLWPAYEMIPGYAWAFPKAERVAVGLGGRAGGTKNIHILHEGFCKLLKESALLPPSAECGHAQYGTITAGGAHRLATHVRGPVVLVGDAGGFAAGATGEGIYHALWTGRCAARLIDEGLERGNIAASLAQFDALWKENIGSSVEVPSGASLVTLLSLLFTSRKVAERVARAYLFGDPFTLF